MTWYMSDPAPCAHRRGEMHNRKGTEHSRALYEPGAWTQELTSLRRLTCQCAIFSLCVLLAVIDCAGSICLHTSTPSSGMPTEDS